LTAIFELLNKVIGKVREFAAENPKLFKIAAAFIAISSGLALLWGGVKVFQALTMVARVFGVTLYATPVIGWIALVIAALAVLYANWDDIVGLIESKTIHWGAVFGNVVRFIYNGIMELVIAPLKFVLLAIEQIGKLFGLSSWVKFANDADAATTKLWNNKVLMSYDDMTSAKPGSAAAARVGLYVPPKGRGAGDAVSQLVPNTDRSTVNNHVTVNLSGGATAADGKLISDSIQSTFDKLMRDHEQRKARRAY
jgi:hypothetical protein